MLIGRSDDPRTPCRVEADKAAIAFGGGSRNPSGPAAACRTKQAGHTTAIAPHQKIFPTAPCTRGAVHTRPAARRAARRKLGAIVVHGLATILTPPIPKTCPKRSSQTRSDPPAETTVLPIQKRFVSRPILGSVESAPEVRVLPSAGVTQPRQYYDPVRHPQGPSSRRCRRRDLHPTRASPNYPAHPSDMPCPLPRWTRTGAIVGCFPAPLGLPRYSGGSASMTSLSRPAQASLTLRPAGLLNRPKAAFVTRLRPARLPDRAARQLPGPTDNSLGGTYLHW